MQTVNSNVSVGIVMRTKDRTVLLRRAFESVLNQSHANWNLIVVNDGGEPNSVDRLVSSIFGTDDRVKVLHHASSKGMEAASNAGITALNTDYAIIHDDDDSWAPDFLKVTTQTLTEKQNKFPNTRGIITHVNSVFETVTANLIQIEKVEPFYIGEFDRLDEGFLSISRMLVRNQFPPIAFLFDLKACKELGMFDETLPVLGDWDFHSRFVLQHDIWVHPEYLAFYHHRISATGALGNTIHAGRHLHRAYDKVLRNKWLRSDLNGNSGSGRTAIYLTLEAQENLRTEIRNLQHTMYQPKYHNVFRQAMSDGFKALKNAIRGKKHG